MKKLFILATLVLGMVSCSKMDDIFNGTDNEAIAPVSLENDYGTDLFSREEIHEIVPDLLRENGIEVHSSLLVVSDQHPYAEAVVINDLSTINEIAAKCDLESKLTKGVFDEYSIIAGFYDCAMGGYSITNQRIKKNLDKIKLYLRIESTDLGVCAPCRTYFMALYPKLPSRPIKIYRSDLDN